MLMMLPTPGECESRRIQSSRGCRRRCRAFFIVLLTRTRDFCSRIYWSCPASSRLSQAPPLNQMSQTVSCCCENVWLTQCLDVFYICERQSQENGYKVNADSISIPSWLSSMSISVFWSPSINPDGLPIVPTIWAAPVPTKCLLPLIPASNCIFLIAVYCLCGLNTQTDSKTDTLAWIAQADL